MRRLCGSLLAAGALCALALALALAPAAGAAECDVSYTGSGGSWSTEANWQGGSLPTSAQNVCIPAGHGTVEVPASFEAQANRVKAESPLTISAGGTLKVSDSTFGNAEADHFGDIAIHGTLTTAGSWLIFTGSTAVDGLVTRSPEKGTDSARLAGGTLTGTGTFKIPFLNETGDVEPGGPGAIGTLSFLAGFAQQEGGTLSLDIAAPGVVDLLEGGVFTNQFFSGAVHVHELGGFVPKVGETWVYGKSGGVLFEKAVVTPSAFKVLSEGSGEALLRLTEALPLEEAEEETSKETPKGGSTGSTGGSSSGNGSTGSGSSSAAGAAAAAAAGPTAQTTEEVLLGCSKRQLVLNDAYIRGGRVVLAGSAAKSLAGRKVAILFNEKRRVASAVVQPNGQFSTTAPLPPAKIRDALSTRYSAAIGSTRSPHLKLTRRLLLEPPVASGTTVTLTGRVTPPLTKPVSPLVVEQQLECGKTKVVETVTPPASGAFRIAVTVPAGTRAAIYTIKSKVAASRRASAKGFTTYSLPLPVAIG